MSFRVTFRHPASEARSKITTTFADRACSTALLNVGFQIPPPRPALIRASAYFNELEPRCPPAAQWTCESNPQNLPFDAVPKVARGNELDHVPMLGELCRTRRE